MEKDDIRKLIAEEIKSETDLTKVYGLDLTKCLIDPVKQTYFHANDKSAIGDFWTVLEERTDRKGYTVFYDEAEGMFGLGVKSADGLLFSIGYYGNFLETLFAM